MKSPSFLIAPDSFKDSLSASEVADCIRKGIIRVFPDAEIRLIPMADGGEGTVQSIVNAVGGRIKKAKAHDALGRLRDSFFGIIRRDSTAVIEMAAASGIEQLERKERNPWLTSTYGTGELIKAALDEGCNEIIVGLGGSATNDGGVGMAMALGAAFTNADGESIGQGGGELAGLVKIDLSNMDPRISKTKIIAATDVRSLLTGEKGASKVYGPQKGASLEMVDKLDRNLIHLGQLIRDDLKKEVLGLPGGGAAGGLGAGLAAFLGADLKSGFETIAALVQLEDHVKHSDIIVTAEGSVDSQTAEGKTPAGVGRISLKYKKPVFVFAGGAGDDISRLKATGITAVIPVSRRPVNLDEAIKSTSNWLELAAMEWCQAIRTGISLSIPGEKIDRREL